MILTFFVRRQTVKFNKRICKELKEFQIKPNQLSPVFTLIDYSRKGRDCRGKRAHIIVIILNRKGNL
jgi:hypothetical protein